MSSKAIGFLNFKFGADLKGFDRAMKKAQKSLKKFGKNIQRTGENLTTGLTLPILGLGAASLKLASDFEETDSKFKSVFSSIQTEAEETAKVLSDSFGLSELSAKQLLSNTGSLLVGFGFTEQSALELSKQVNELAVDLASFTNFSGGAEGASRALTKALLGERESLKSLDIAITETDLKDFAADHGLVWKELDRVAKAQLTYQLALKQSQPAVGDFEKTQAGFANQVRITKGELTDAAISLGEHLLPMAQKAIAVVRGLIDRFNALSVSTKENIVKWGLIVAAIGPALIIFGKLVVGVSALIKLFGALRIAVLATSGAFKALTVAMVKNPIGAVIAAVTSAAAAYFLLGENTKKAKRAQDEFNGSTEATADTIKRISKSLEDMGKDSIQMQIEEVQGLIKNIKGFEVKESAFTKGIGLSDEQKKQIKDLNMLLFQLKQKQFEAKQESDELAKSIENVGGAVGDLGDEVEGVSDDWTKNMSLIGDTVVWKEAEEAMSSVEDQFKGLVVWQTKLTDAQKLAKAGFQMFGDVLTSSLDEALSSQEKFFPIFIKNIKRAIQSLLVQLAVMTLISAIMPGTMGGLGKAAFTKGGILKNLSSLMNIPAMADGGVVMGPQMALIGEAGPEAVIPLDQLKNFGGSQQVEVVGKISGNDIFLSNRNTGTNRQRSV